MYSLLFCFFVKSSKLDLHTKRSNINYALKDEKETFTQTWLQSVSQGPFFVFAVMHIHIREHCLRQSCQSAPWHPPRDERGGWGVQLKDTVTLDHLYLYPLSRCFLIVLKACHTALFIKLSVTNRLRLQSQLPVCANHHSTDHRIMTTHSAGSVFFKESTNCAKNTVFRHTGSEAYSSRKQ